MTTRPTTTRTFALLGHPVAHSLSPTIHHAAYAELGVTGTEYVLRDCPDEAAVRGAFAALRDGSLAGANVTVPWKRLALELSDDVDESARATGAANVLRPVTTNGETRVVAFNTDVPALAAELRRGFPEPRSAVILGNGGAALAAVAACRLLGVASPVVTARKWRGQDETAWNRAAEFRGVGAVPVGWPESAATELAARAAESDLIVQSTSDGMHGATDGSAVTNAVPWSALRPDTFVYDVVYNPAETPFLRAARARGLRAETGLGMLVGQAALAVSLWLGVKPPEAPLALAARRALAEKMRP